MNWAASALGVGTSENMLGPTRLVVAPVGQPAATIRHCGPVGGEMSGAACAVPGPKASATPAPAIAIPVANGYMEFFMGTP
ncbi:hypothetical protein TUM20985_38240 [Mycobacterium antarcticum]|nr:hypothetical protein TUM20985_38240 [Mycolicibacterium sp. TUM20985]GLP83169.1 hypothetical protein TUM20984_45890 [Mycolicibacterium sp. TUM20984]